MKTIKYLLLITIILSLTSCGIIDQTEISGLSVVEMLAIDETDDGEISASILSRDLKDEEGEGSKSFLTATESSFSALERELQKRYEKKLFWGHVDYFIFGEAVARGNIYKHLNFFSNDPHFRMNAYVYLTDRKTTELLEKSEEGGYYLPDYIKHFSQTSQLLSESSKMTLFDLIEKKESPIESFTIPRISVMESEESITLRVDGYGIMKNGYLAGYLDNEQAKGYNILTNQMDDLIIDINFMDNDVSLKQLKSKTKITPILEDNKLKKIKIDLETKSDILEIRSTDGIKILNYISELEHEQEKMLSAFIESTILKMKEYKADIIKISKLYRRKFPENYNFDNWDDVIANLEFDINADCKINRSYDSRGY